MKKIRVLFAALSVTGVLFSGCFNFTGGNKVNSDDTVGLKNKNKKEISLLISNFDELDKLTSGSAGRSAKESEKALPTARTIVSEGYASGDLKFYITGTSSNNDDLTVTDVTDDVYGFDEGNPNKGKVTLTIDEYAWNLEMYACPSEDAPEISGGDNAAAKANVIEKAVLKGTTYIDMFNTTQAYFTLSPNALGKEAQVNLTLKLGTDWPKKGDAHVVPHGYSVKAGIYDIETGALINTSKENTSTEMDVSATDISSASGYAYTANTTNGGENKVTVDCGTYNFMISFINNETGENYVWSDTIIILPGKGCEAEVVVPNVIGKLPAVPENFKAYYIEGSEDEVTDMYKVMFQWEDKSNNESYFEIQMIDRNKLADIKWKEAYKDNATMSTWSWESDKLVAGEKKEEVSAAKLWTAVDSYYDKDDACVYPDFVELYGADFYSKDIRAEGALLANNKTATIYLPLGTSYEARIFAVNAAGRSANADGTRAACNVALNGTADPAVQNGQNAKSFNGSTNAFGVANNGTATADASNFGVTGSARTNNATTISRFRIQYYLQGGTFDADGPETGEEGAKKGDKAKPQTGTIVEYYSQDAAVGNYIIYPEGDGDSVDKPVLNFGGSYYYEYWAESLDGPTTETKEGLEDDALVQFQKHIYASVKEENPTRYKPNMYKGYKNLDLYAKYRVDALIEIVDPSDVALKPEWISYAQASASGSSPVAFVTLTEDSPKTAIEIAKNSSGEAGGTAYETMNWKVTVPGYSNDSKESDKINYNFTSLSIKLYKGNEVYWSEKIEAADNNEDAAVNEFTGLPLKRLKSGQVYNLLISAQYGSKTNGAMTSVPITLQIVDFPSPTEVGGD